MQVVTKVRVFDQIGGNELISKYRFRDGFYDRREREFRGFGMVEQRDAEEFNQSGPTATRPPVVTKRWFSTGSAESLTTDGWYDGDPDHWTLAPFTGTPEEVRAIRGRLLREEVYAEDGATEESHPYVTTEHRHEARVLQPADANPYAVVLAIPAETLTHHYERRLDPRVAHEMTLDVDDRGVIRRAASVAYPRRAALEPEQSVRYCSVSEVDVVHRDSEADWYRIGVPFESRSYEIVDLPAPSGQLDPAAVRTALGQSVDVPFSPPDPGVGSKRLLHASRAIYRSDADAADVTATPLALGTIESKAIGHESLEFAFTAAKIADIFGTRVSDADLVAAGYSPGPVGVDKDGWWARTQRASLVPSAFMQPTGMVDPFGNTASVDYDATSLRAIGATDPVGNSSSIVLDYRLLTTVEATDPNGNRQLAAFDPFGQPTAVAVQGKPGENLGDTLAEPTITFRYDESAWLTSQQPPSVTQRHRETHGDPTTRWFTTVSFADGFGRDLVSKAIAAPGDVTMPDGSTQHADPRWVASGQTVYDNKGAAVRQYEPYFSATFEFEPESDLLLRGVTSVATYDPIGRLVRRDDPNGTFVSTEFDAWTVIQHDANDNVLLSDWYAQRNGTPGAEGDVAAKAAAHANTPTVVHLDALGRSFLTIEDGGDLPGGGHLFVDTRYRFDLAGNSVEVTDARGNQALLGDYAATGEMLSLTRCDAGRVRTLQTSDGLPLFKITAVDHEIEHTYDAARRPSEQLVKEVGFAWRADVRWEYGEAAPNASAANLRGALWRQWDQTGLNTELDFDFAGNRVAWRAEVLDAADLGQVDWGSPSAPTPRDSYEFAATYDARGEMTRQTYPTGHLSDYRFDSGGQVVETDMTGPSGTITNLFFDIRYDEHGRAVSLTRGNGVSSTWTYDQETGHLVGITSLRGQAALQDQTLTWDPNGNLTTIHDDAHPDGLLQERGGGTAQVLHLRPAEPSRCRNWSSARVGHAFTRNVAFQSAGPPVRRAGNGAIQREPTSTTVSATWSSSSIQCRPRPPHRSLVSLATSRRPTG